MLVKEVASRKRCPELRRWRSLSKRRVQFCNGGIVTKKYPSDSDEAVTQKYPSDNEDGGAVQ